MAVMSARSIAVRLVDIQRVNSLHLRLVEEMRREAVRITVNLLWRRYKDHQKREKSRTFGEWLAFKKDLEKTFWHKTTGASLPVRRRWAFQYFNFLTRKELTLGDDPLNMWMLEALEEELNRKANHPGYRIRVEAKSYRAIPSHRLKEGTSFAFEYVPHEPEG